MKKIPTLFMRDPENRKYVTREQNPECDWVFAGEGVATRKWDGTCVMYDGTRWWSRREVKEGGIAPADFHETGYDENTGKYMGWVPAESSSFHKYLLEAADDGYRTPGTYELVGPKINGNPEGELGHVLVSHGSARTYPDAPRTYEGLQAFMADFTPEGLVWHHPDGRMAKIKKRDFPRVVE